jgi:hypothetical protein
MKREFTRILIVVLAGFAVFAFVYPGDLSEDDSGGSQSEMLQASYANVPTPRDHHGGAVGSPRLFTSNKSTCSAGFSASTTSPALLSVAGCVLRC